MLMFRRRMSRYQTRVINTTFQTRHVLEFERTNARDEFALAAAHSSTHDLKITELKRQKLLLTIDSSQHDTKK
jgi:hypothetical protein